MSHEIDASEGFIGKHRIVADLGGGGMADVFLAVGEPEQGLGRLRVVKQLRREMLRDPEMCAMFLDEARLALQVSHPAVVQTHELGEAEGRAFLVMEYIEGHPLHRVRQEHQRRLGSPVPAEIELRAIAGFLPGLSYLHALADAEGQPLHLVHRDISPHNIMVTYEGASKIVDFGIAKAKTNENATRKGLFKGKIGYSAPEQMRGGAVDARTDVYAVGVMLWEAVAGRSMWKGEDDLTVVQRVVSGDLPSLQAVAPGTPPALERLCARALALAPDARYPSVAALQADLEAYLTGAHPGLGPAEVGDFVTKLLFSARERVRRAVERKLGQLSEDPEARLTVVELFPAQVGEPSQAALAMPLHPITMPPPAAAAAPPSMSRLGWAAALSVLLGGAILWAARPAPRAPDPPRAAALAAQATPPAEPRPAAPIPAAPIAAAPIAAAPIPAEPIAAEPPAPAPTPAERAAPPAPTATASPEAAAGKPDRAVPRPVASAAPPTAAPPTAAPPQPAPAARPATWDKDSPFLPP
jgi:serine/threonine-protein kinase